MRHKNLKAVKSAWTKVNFIRASLSQKQKQKWYFVTKIVLTECEKNCSSNQEKNLKFKAEGREFAKFLISPEQFIRTVKGQNNF